MNSFFFYYKFFFCIIYYFFWYIIVCVLFYFIFILLKNYIYEVCPKEELITELYIISKALYFAPLLDSNENNSKNVNILVFIPLLKLTIKNVKVIQILMTANPIIIKLNKLKKTREKLNPFLLFPEISILSNDRKSNIILIAPSERKMKSLLRHDFCWANKNEMSFGINKCATMVVKPLNFVSYPEIHNIFNIFELFYILFFKFFLFLISNVLFTYMYFFYNKINKVLEVYSLPFLKKKKKKLKLFFFYN